MADVTQARILIMATNGFEQSELMVPLQQLRAAGAHVDVAAPEAGHITGWDNKDWGHDVPVDRLIDEVDAAGYDALVLPGGQMNPDILRMNETVISLIQHFHDDGKVIAAICHAPWLLIEAGIAKGRRMTSWPSLRTDLVNAGAAFHDEAVVADKGIITSRKPDDLDAFVAKIIEEIGEGRHERSRGDGAMQSGLL
jgi:protease I